MVRSGITIEWLTEPTAAGHAGLRITNTCPGQCRHRLRPVCRGSAARPGGDLGQPDAFYREVFEMLLAGMLSDTSSTLLSEARRRADSSPYIVFDEIVPLTR